MRVYTSQELKKFGELIEKYKYRDTIKIGKDAGKEVEIYDMHKIMCAYGAEKETIRTFSHWKTGEPYEVKEYSVWPPRMKEFENLWQQFTTKLGAIRYARDKYDEELDQLAGTMKLNTNEQDN